MLDGSLVAPPLAHGAENENMLLMNLVQYAVDLDYAETQRNL